MGQQIVVQIHREPEWAEIRDCLTALGEHAIVRMIDGLPAFPEEIPEPGWRELRLGLNGGMVSLRREADQILCVAWGNADAALLQSWRACADAVAKAAG